MILLVGSMDMTLLTGGKKGTNPPRELFSGRAVLFLATARTVLEFSVGFSKSLFLVYCTIVADSLWKWAQGHFIKYDIQGVFLKWAEILPTRLWDNV
jgi:hypothetical protein